MCKTQEEVRQTHKSSRFSTTKAKLVLCLTAACCNTVPWETLFVLVRDTHSLLGSIFTFSVIDMSLLLDLAKPVGLVGLGATVAGRAAHIGCKKVFKVGRRLLAGLRALQLSPLFHDKKRCQLMPEAV